MRRNHKYLLAISISLLVQGCDSSATPQVTEESALPIVMTVTDVQQPTVTPSVTLTAEPTPTRIIPTPTFPAIDGSTFRLFDFIFEQSTPDCSLPCWNGLVPGESNLNDIQQGFDSVFGMNGTFDFFNPDTVRLGTKLLNSDDLYAAGYFSYIPDIVY